MSGGNPLILIPVIFISFDNLIPALFSVTLLTWGCPPTRENANFACDNTEFCIPSQLKGFSYAACFSSKLKLCNPSLG